MLTNTLRRNEVPPLNGRAPRPPQGAVVLPLDRRSGFSAQVGSFDRAAVGWPPRGPATEESEFSVEISPADIVKRRQVSWDGMSAEIVQATRRDRIDTRFHAPVHLLVLGEHGARREGETLVEGLPRSSLRDYRRKLTFVPAGRDYHDWQLPRTLTRMVYFYLHPAKLPVESAQGLFTPRLFFENAALWDTAIKLANLIETPGSHNPLYLEALGVVLGHELARLGETAPRSEPQVKGGLAAWQQRIAVAHIEEHLDEHISLATLAGMVRLSPYYFCRAFKQSFGIPPHRYHTSRRIERAKALLAKSNPSVTGIGLELGFSETSSFTAAFRKATGLTPTAFHRSLA